jgi:hypothetical protein
MLTETLYPDHVQVDRVIEVTPERSTTPAHFTR